MSGSVRRRRSGEKENKVGQSGAKHVDDNAHKAKPLVSSFIKFSIRVALQRQVDIGIKKFIVRFGHVLFVHAEQSVTMTV